MTLRSCSLVHSQSSKGVAIRGLLVSQIIHIRSFSLLVIHRLAVLGLVRHLHPMRRHGNHGGLGIGITDLTRKREVLFCLAPVLFRIHCFDFASFSPHPDRPSSHSRAATVTHLRARLLPWRATT